MFNSASRWPSLSFRIKLEAASLPRDVMGQTRGGECRCHESESKMLHAEDAPVVNAKLMDRKKRGYGES